MAKMNKDQNKDNWPDRVWIENLNGAYIHATNASLTDPKLDPHFTDHRVMREYVLRSVAGKEQSEAYVRGLNQNRFDHDMDLQRIKTEILKPIREVIKQENQEGQRGSMPVNRWNLIDAIKQTLDLADKVGK